MLNGLKWETQCYILYPVQWDPLILQAYEWDSISHTMLVPAPRTGYALCLELGIHKDEYATISVL